MVVVQPEVPQVMVMESHVVLPVVNTNSLSPLALYNEKEAINNQYKEAEKQFGIFWKQPEYSYVIVSIC